MGGILRMGEDPGYLSNKRMALEIGLGLAHLCQRTLSMPIDRPIGSGPRPAVADDSVVRLSNLRDLYELPVPVIGDDEYATITAAEAVHVVDWPVLGDVVIAESDAPVDEDDEAFAHGRPTMAVDPAWTDHPVIDLPARGLGLYSFVFRLAPERRRQLYELMHGVRLAEPYRRLAADVAAGLGDFDAVHLRRSDMLTGVPQYRAVSPWHIRDNLATVIPSGRRLLVCSELEADSDVFVPLRQHYPDLVFMTEHLLENHTSALADLPRRDDAAIAAISQEVAGRAGRFVGTFASTFTAMIQRERCLRDPSTPFLFTADFFGGESRFEQCEYHAVHQGPFSWNRLGYPLAPATLSWIREWPEVASVNDAGHVPGN